MYDTIMVPTDGSGFDREAIRVALRVASRSRAKVRLVRVRAKGAYLGHGDYQENPDIHGQALAQERSADLSELYALAAECRNESDAEIIVDLEHGPVAEVLAGYARRHNVDLIVISSHARGGIARMSLGSVTDSLIRHTTTPVLVVRPPASYLNPQVSGDFRRIVIPLDGSVLAEQVIERAQLLAQLHGTELMLVRILRREPGLESNTADQTTGWWQKDFAIAQSYLFGVADRLKREGHAVTTEVIIAHNVPGAIRDFARRERADLIAIATHGRGGLNRIFRGSVADEVSRTSSTSALVFHPNGTQRDSELNVPLHESLETSRALLA